MRETVMTRPARDSGNLYGRMPAGRLRLWLSLAALALAGAGAGCSSDRIGADASASASPSITDRVTGIFRGAPEEPHYAGVATPSAPTAVASASGAEAVAPGDLPCPSVDVRIGASTLSVPPPTDSAEAMNLKYQGTIGKLARECSVSGGNMRIKVGMQGRIILGPAGGPGVVDVPLRYAVVKEGPQPRTVVSDFFKVPVTVPADQTNVAFTHIDESIAFPMPPAADLESYVIYVGFDPMGAKQAPAAKRPAAKRARTSSSH